MFSEIEVYTTNATRSMCVLVKLVNCDESALRKSSENARLENQALIDVKL